MSLYFSFPIDEEASFVLDRYLEEFNQRMLLQAATIASNSMKSKIESSDIYLALLDALNKTEGEFLLTKVKSNLQQEWRVKNPTNLQRESAEPGAVS